MERFTFTLIKSCLIILLAIITPLFAFAQPSAAYPADEATFMAQTNNAYRAGNHKMYMEMLTIGVGRGYSDAEANMGAIFMSSPGKDGKYRFDLAVKLFSKAADKGHAGAMYMLATSYRSGLGVTTNMEMYRYWIKRAAKAGSLEAQRACSDEGLSCR